MSAVASNYLKWYLSGGSVGVTNTNPFLSVGGVITNTVIVHEQVLNLFDEVTNLETVSGSTNYRVIFLKNVSTGPLKNIVLFFTKLDAYVSFEVNHEGKNLNTPVLDNESTKPSTVNIGFDNDTPAPFTKVTDNRKTSQAVIPDLDPNDFIAVYARRITPPNIEDEVRRGPYLSVYALTK